MNLYPRPSINLGGFASGLLMNPSFHTYRRMTLNDLVLENIYEDVLAEAKESGNLPMYSLEDIDREVMDRFHSLTP